MNRTKPAALAAVSIAALMLCACGGDGDDRPRVTIDELGTGAYLVSTGDEAAPTVGRYFAGSDGSRLLVLSDAEDRATALYRRGTSGGWTAVPAAGQDVRITLLRSEATAAATLTPTMLAGSYVTRLASGAAAAFSIAADGSIAAGATGCKLTGRLAAGALPNTLKLELAAAGCDGLPARSTGVLAADAEEAPARFRLLADDGAQRVDLWGFAE